MSRRERLVSLGAGVQSSAMLPMLDAGELPGPRTAAALFADTGWEPANAYTHLEYLERTVRCIHIHPVRAPATLRQQLLDHTAGRGRFASPPLHALNRDGGDGRLRRQCTREFKLEPMWAWLRKRGYGSRRRVVQLLGITIDELERAKHGRLNWAAVAWPLIDAGMTPGDCQAWLATNGHPDPPKSACIGCPLRSDFGWSWLMVQERADGIEVDEAIRRLPGLDSPAFFHRARVPLAELDLRSPAERGQLSLLDAECDGWCAT